MNKFSIIALLLTISSFSFSQSKEDKDSLTWYTDVNKAFALSKATNKPMFAFFTGSDWCGWCHKMEKEIFAKPAFIKWANSNVILLELDFPRRKQLPPELAQQNQALQNFFQVPGYPTIWIFNMSQDLENKRFLISPLGSLGYPQQVQVGKEEVPFLENANSILAKNNGK